MRIFCAVRHSTSPKLHHGGLWSGNFYPALRELGHEIVESQVDLAPTSRFMHVGSGFTPQEAEVRDRTTEQILKEVQAAQSSGPIHLFLSYFYNAHFNPAGFDELRRSGTPSVNFYCNSIYQLDLVADVAAKADFAWHPERNAGPSYAAIGANPVWVQMAADPSVYGPVEGMKRAPKACFVGQRYADRDRWVAALVRARAPVDLYGSGWGPANCPAERSAYHQNEYLGRSLSRPGSASSYAKLIRQSLTREGLVKGCARIARHWNYWRKTHSLSPLFYPLAKGWAQNLRATFAAYEVCLNFSNVWADGHPGSSLIPHVRLRDFEGPMCRVCYLTGHTDEIEGFYELGKEIETYRTPGELVEKTQYYLRNPSAAERLREAGYRRAVRDHTWAHRFHELLQKIGLEH